MKTLLKISAPLLFVAMAMFFGNSAHAAEGDVTVTLGGNEKVIPKATVDSWRGNFTAGEKPMFMGGSTSKARTGFDPKKIYDWVTASEAETNSEPANPSLTITNNQATQFTPPNIGKRLDSVATTAEIITALSARKSEVAAVIHEIEPETTLASTNNLGITELVGRGKSNFKGSPRNRRHNINVGVEKLKGIILAPGEEFSFDDNICPVEKSTGYLPELVIKAEGTIPEYGGGLCQVSSTVFRAAMDAGLKITQRKNHSYAVQYYAPQGTDATTYCGGVDFKFVNDMNTSVLIWPYLVGNDDLVFDFYGTKDGRQIVLEDPIQYDKKRDGSMKATWVRHVTKNGITNTDTFNSTYLPPALFHREETAVAPPANPPVGGLQVPAGTQTPPPPAGVPTT